MKLKPLRVILALITGTLLTVSFLDLSGWLPVNFLFLNNIQLVPALLAGMWWVVGAILLFTVLFGRVYCSVLCPFGILMDGIIWVRRRFKPKMKQPFRREKRVLRWSVLAAVVIAYLLGATVVLNLLEPYSAFGRIVTHLFRPVFSTALNGLTGLFNLQVSDASIQPEVLLFSVSSLLIAAVTFGTIIVLATFYGRSWCNTLCPVGTVLGYVSKYALFKVRIDASTCSNCGRCEKLCKASCIDNTNKRIDDSRCVACFNCLSLCKLNGIRYGLPQKREGSTAPVDASRRLFVGTLALTSTAATLLPVSALAQNLTALSGRVPIKRKTPISPPGSQGIERLKAHCTACHLCVAKCPNRVLKPALLEYGVEGLMQPRLDFTHGYCPPDCTVCTTVCPNEALVVVAKKEKQRLQMGQVVFIKKNCTVFTNETLCGACSERCPTQAVYMIPYKDGLMIPAIDATRCLGCGGCEFVCPALPIKAIYVEGSPLHAIAKLREITQKTVTESDNFGF